jgi:hypothetical protein
MFVVHRLVLGPGSSVRACWAGELHCAHLLLDSLHRTSPKPNHLGDLQDANALLELLLRLPLQGRPLRNAARTPALVSADLAVRSPMTGMADGCARSANGDTIVPASPAMNSRRLILETSPCIPKPSAAEIVRELWFALQSGSLHCVSPLLGADEAIGGQQVRYWGTSGRGHDAHQTARMTLSRHHDRLNARIQLGGCGGKATTGSGAATAGAGAVTTGPDAVASRSASRSLALSTAQSAVT